MFRGTVDDLCTGRVDGLSLSSLLPMDGPVLAEGPSLVVLEGLGVVGVPCSDSSYLLTFRAMGRGRVHPLTGRFNCGRGGYVSSLYSSRPLSSMTDGVSFRLL